MSEFVEVTTDYDRYYSVFPHPDWQDRWLVSVHENVLASGLGPHRWYGGKVLNQHCPAHSTAEAHRLAKVFWMERLGADYASSKLAVASAPTSV